MATSARPGALLSAGPCASHSGRLKRVVLVRTVEPREGTGPVPCGSAQGNAGIQWHSVNFVKEGGPEKIVLAGPMQYKGTVPSFLLRTPHGLLITPVPPREEGGHCQAGHSGAARGRTDSSPGEEET